MHRGVGAASFAHSSALQCVPECDLGRAVSREFGSWCCGCGLSNNDSCDEIIIFVFLFYSLYLGGIRTIFCRFDSRLLVLVTSVMKVDK